MSDIETLQKADINELLRLWQGLGYYSRVKNIHNAANIIFKISTINSQIIIKN